MQIPDEPPACAGPQPTTRKPDFTPPPGAADCHAHLFGPRDQYPYNTERVYNPPNVFLRDYHSMLSALGIERGVLVQ